MDGWVYWIDATGLTADWEQLESEIRVWPGLGILGPGNGTEYAVLRQVVAAYGVSGRLKAGTGLIRNGNAPPAFRTLRLS